MADELEIQIGDQSVRVPRWATEETAKEMAKYNQASARALTEMVRQTNKGNKVVLENQKLFRKMQQETRQDHTESIQAEKKLNTYREKHGKILESSSKKIQSASKGFMEAFNQNSLSGMAAALAGLVGLGAGVTAAFGFAIKALENFSKSVSDLANTGLGLGVSLVELRHQASMTGLDMEAYGKIVSGNGDALRALGDSAQDGARTFSVLSHEARRASREFNNFGLTNTEFNEILLEEIELRRRSGMAQADITASASESMRNLMLETTALAAMTGQDRREMIRRRREMMEDPVITAMRLRIEREGGALSDNFNSLATAFGAGGEVGSQLGMAIAKSMETGIDFRAINGGLMGRIAAMNTEAGSMMDEINRFVQANMESMDTREFNTRLVSMLSDLSDSIPAEDLRQLGIAAERGREGAAELISLVSELQGLESSVEANREAYDAAVQGLRDSDVLALSGAVQDLTTAFADSALNSVLGQFDAELDEAGAQLVDTLRTITDNLGLDIGLAEGLTNSYAELTDAMDRLKHGAIAAAVAIGALALTAGGRRLLGGMMRGSAARNPLRRAPRAASAATTGSLSRIASQGGRLLRFGAPPLAAATAIIAPSELGDGTIDPNNPPAAPTQAEIDAAAENYATERHTALNPPFEERSFLETNDMLSEQAANVPGSRSTLDMMRRSGSIDAETHAILTGRSFQRMEEYMRRQAEATERLRRTIEESQ